MGLLQAFTLQLLHHDEGMPVVILNAVNCADVGMISIARPPLAFTFESFQRLGRRPTRFFRNEL